MKKRFLVPISIMIAGMISLLVSIYGNRDLSSEAVEMNCDNVESFRNGDIVTVFADPAEMGEGLYCVELMDDTREYTVLVRAKSGGAIHLDGTGQMITGRFYVPTKKDKEIVMEFFSELYQAVEGNLPAIKEKNPEFELTPLDEIRESLKYGIMLPSVMFPRVFGAIAALLISLGGCILLIMLLRLFLSRKKTMAVIAFMFLAMIAVIVIILLPKIKTVLSVHKEGDGIWSMDYEADYLLDACLEADVKDLDQLTDWAIQNLLYHLPAEVNQSSFKCSAFTALSPEGTHLYGRNMDFPETDSLVLHLKPINGYESICVVDLSFMGIGVGGSMDVNDPKARITLLAAPYAINDGVNEKGLCVSGLSLSYPHVVEDTAKHDLLINISARALLDKCATTDEAIDFLSNYDMYSPTNHSIHLFISDRSGKSVIVEWSEEDGKMQVVEGDKVVNFALYDFDESKDRDGRYATLKKTLTGAPMTYSEAMGLLRAVAQPNWTRWSAVYDLDHVTMDLCVNEEYDKIYHFSLEDFR